MGRPAVPHRRQRKASAVRSIEPHTGSRNRRHSPHASRLALPQPEGARRVEARPHRAQRKQRPGHKGGAGVPPRWARKRRQGRTFHRRSGPAMPGPCLRYRGSATAIGGAASITPGEGLQDRPATLGGRNILPPFPSRKRVAQPESTK